MVHTEATLVLLTGVQPSTGDCRIHYPIEKIRTGTVPGNQAFIYYQEVQSRESSDYVTHISHSCSTVL